MLIDASGTDPFDPVQRDETAGLAATANAQTALVLPAGLDACESADLAQAFAGSGATMLVATRLDLARRLGGVLAAAEGGGLTMVEAGTGPGAADGLVALTPRAPCPTPRTHRPFARRIAPGVAFMSEPPHFSCPPPATHRHRVR